MPPPEQMVDRTARADRERHHRDHVRWLMNEHVELQQHRHTASMRSEEDFAVDYDETTVQFESSSFASNDEEVTYRGLDISSFTFESSIEMEVDAEPVVYRSLSLAQATGGQQERSSRSSSSAADADASWLAAGRPPLLQRQRAFQITSSDADGFLGMDP